MSDSFTQVTSDNYFQRLLGSFVGAVFGLVLFFVAIGVLVWNESRAVDALRGLGEAAKDVVETTPSPVDPALNRKLVHLTGALSTKSPLTDPTMGLSKSDLIHLKRTVEMYQWKESEESNSSNSIGGSATTTKTYTYAKTWSDEPIDSDRFEQASSHRNPEMPIKTSIVTARDATLGERTLAPALLDELDSYETIQPPSAAPDGYRREGDALYRGNGSPGAPQIGDVRVSFSAVPTQTVSVMAQQNGTSLAPFRTQNGYQVGLVSAGDVGADDMVAQKRSEEKTLTWILRAVGFAMFFFSLLLIASPLSALANVLPFVASIIGGSVFLFALGLAIPLTLVTVALSWVVFRPLLGVGLLVAAVVCIVAYRRMRPGHPKVAA